ncbi:MAG TPA: DUF308 domain-containing protein [Candidatus Egerieousia sp.]|nr:DUF308 domain-containing protein [Candidatus Egerieousia sp.]HPT05978.1 DUF308 domain-containing protein [Candidatus Egerieousia sp.]
MRNLIRAIFVLVLGFCLALWPTVSSKYIVLVLGWCFIAAGVANIVYAFTTRIFIHILGMGFLTTVSAIIFIALGSWMLCMPQTFLSIMAFLFGAVLVIYGIAQLVHTYKFTKGGKNKALVYTLPIIALIIGVIFFFRSKDAIKLLTMFFGFGLILFGVAEFILDVKYVKAKRIMKAAAAAEAARIEASQKSVGEPSSEKTV